jgi:cyanate permease
MRLEVTRCRTWRPLIWEPRSSRAHNVVNLGVGILDGVGYCIVTIGDLFLGWLFTLFAS